MTTKMKNRCTVQLRQNGSIVGTFRPTQRLFHSLQKELEPYRTLYDKKCFITLKQEDVLMGNYKIDEKRFNKIKDRVEPYRSIGHICKNVRCIETGRVFENARKAAEWISFVRERGYCNPDLIKRACRKKGTCFDYHWEFVKDKNSKIQ